MSEEKIKKLRPILEWAKKSAPYAKDREAASSILHSLREVGDLEQVILGKRESDLLITLIEAFPEVSVQDPKPKQLKLFTDSIFDPTPTYDVPFWEKKGLPGPPRDRVEEKKPELKRTLTKEEQEERVKLGLPPLAWNRQESE